jgi:hypothetical protein
VWCSDIEASVTQDPRSRQLLLLLPFLVCGCVGFATVRPRETTDTLPIADGVTSESATRADLLTAWGEPGAKRSAGGDEIWTYERNRRWAGVVLLPVVPVPLLLPVAHDRVEFRFRGDTLVDTRVWRVEGRVAMCGLATGPCSVPGCYVGP